MRTRTAPVVDSQPDALAEAGAWLDRQEAEQRERLLQAKASEIEHDRRMAERRADPQWWIDRLAQKVVCPVIASWSDCPVPKLSVSSVLPNGLPAGVDLAGRPLAYDASNWRLDHEGIWWAPGNVWVSTPVFQTRQGTPGRPARYAVLAGANWKIISGPDIPPRRSELYTESDPAGTVNLLIRNGVRVNTATITRLLTGEPLPGGAWGADMVANGHIREEPVAVLLDQFLRQHRTEAPQ